MSLGRFHPVLLPALIGLVFSEASSSHAFVLISPASDASLVAGQPVDVVVDPGRDIGMNQVRYYWYRLDEEPMVARVAIPALVATSAAAPPYGGKLLVPPDAMGRMRLLAVGDVARGRMAGQEDFDEVLVMVTAPAELQRIEFEVEKPWRLDTLGKILEVPVVAQYADGVSRRIGGKFAGSSYQSTNNSVIEVTAEGLVRVLGNGKATIVVTNSGKQGTLEVLVRAEGDEANRPPTARTLSELIVHGGSKVVLNGLDSTDPDGDPIRYEWMQVLGNKVSLLDSNSPQAIFMAPKVSSRRLLRFALRVTDMKGPDTVKGADSFPAYIDVWVLP